MKIKHFWNEQVYGLGLGLYVDMFYEGKLHHITCHHFIVNAAVTVAYRPQANTMHYSTTEDLVGGRGNACLMTSFCFLSEAQAVLNPVHIGEAKKNGDTADRFQWFRNTVHIEDL